MYLSIDANGCVPAMYLQSDASCQSKPIKRPRDPKVHRAASKLLGWCFRKIDNRPEVKTVISKQVLVIQSNLDYPDLSGPVNSPDNRNMSKENIYTA